eukprot:2094583-Rhodomonas_salina.4
MSGTDLGPVADFADMPLISASKQMFEKRLALKDLFQVIAGKGGSVSVEPEGSQVSYDHVPAHAVGNTRY